MEQPNIFMSYLRVTQHMSQQFRSHFGRLDLTFPQALVLTVLGEDVRSWAFWRVFSAKTSTARVRTRAGRAMRGDASKIIPCAVFCIASRGK